MGVTDIGIIRGVIELQDEYTGTIGLAEAALSNFAKDSQESLKAVAVAGGLAAATFTAIGAAIVELGERGALVSNVERTVADFAGGAERAEEIIKRMNKATLGTVDDFELASVAAHLLSAGVNLTADQFGTLGAAAEVLKKRGLGETKEMLDLVSNAMVSGRTRSLQLKLGVVDVTDAEEKYAKSLGVTKDQLSDTGKIEAKRIEVMEILDKAVARAGLQTRDFGEQMKAAEVSVVNWVDDLAQAVAASPALAAGFKVINDAVAEAFGGDNKDAIKATMEYVKSFAVVAVDVGLGMVEFARIVNVVWSTIKAGALAVDDVIINFAGAFVLAFEGMTRAAAALHLVPEGAVEAVKSVRTQLEGMALDLDKQTAEAAKGIIGQSEFDKTLDHLGGTLYRVKDAINGAAASAAEGNKEAEIAANNARMLAKTQDDLAKSFVNRQKIEDELWKVEEKSLKETSALWSEYFALRVHQSGSSFDAQRADIEKWRVDEIAKLDASDRSFKEHYDAIQALAKAKLEGIGSEWDSVKDKSIEANQEAADAALRAYNEMIFGGQHFTREVLDAQLQHYHDLQDAVRGYGAEAKAAEEQAAAAARAHTKELERIEEAAKAAAAAMRALGGSMTYDLSTAQGQQTFLMANPLASIHASLEYFLTHTLQQAVAEGLVVLDNRIHNRPTGFAEGGTVMVGERGPEVMRVPFGTEIFPTGTRPAGGGGITVNNTFHVNGTATDVARQVGAVIMRQLKSQRQFGAA